ncbi:MAG: pilus assembly protein PilM [bacterium]
MIAINFDALKGLVSRLTPKPNDVLGLDIARSGIKAVRVRRNADGTFALVAADILPGVTLPKKPDDAVEPVPALKLPKNLLAKYAALAVTGENAIVKLLSFPGRAETLGAELDGKVMDSMAMENPNLFRVNYMVLTEGQSKTECRALAVAVPEVEAKSAVMLLPSGLPTPNTIEVSGLAAMTAFLQSAGSKESDSAVGMLEFGSGASFFAVFNKKVPVLIRKFDVGSAHILGKVQESLGVDRATAEGILADGSFDISQQMGDVMDGFVKQIMVSRDFVERRENCRIARVYVSGGATKSRDWLTELKSALGYDVSTWNPFDSLKVPEGALTENLKGQESRFAAAVGAALATLAEANP